MRDLLGLEGRRVCGGGLKRREREVEEVMVEDE